MANETGTVRWCKNCPGRDVGRGLALITVSESQILGGRNREFEPLASLKTSNPVVPPLESTILLFDVAGSTLERGTMSVNSCIGRGVRGNGLFAIDVVYSASAGAMTYRARFQVVPRDPEPGFVVFQIDYFRGDSRDPLATVRVDSPLPRLDVSQHQGHRRGIETNPPCLACLNLVAPTNRKAPDRRRK